MVEQEQSEEAMEDKDFGILVGKLETFQENVLRRLDDQKESLRRIFTKLEDYGNRIAVAEKELNGLEDIPDRVRVVEKDTGFLKKALLLIPTLVGLLVSIYALWLRYGK